MKKSPPLPNKPGGANKKSETRSEKSEIRTQKSESRSQRADFPLPIPTNPLNYPTQLERKVKSKAVSKGGNLCVVRRGARGRGCDAPSPCVLCILSHMRKYVPARHERIGSYKIING